MKTPYFFGYGSLVNRQTHDYPDAQIAQLNGWRRVWRQTTLRPRPILTVEPDPATTIAGLIARVPNHDWQALDHREALYDREPITSVDATGLTTAAAISTYTVPCHKYPAPTAPHPIPLSYLDVVVQGYLNEFVEDGAQAFFDTTTGWHAPIQNDRAAPIYARNQSLTTAQTRFVDDQIARLGCKILA